MAEFKKVKYYYDAELAQDLAEKIKPHYPAFDQATFIRMIAEEVEDLELKARVNVFADALRACLPEDFPQAASILHKILGPENPNETGMFTEGYWLMPVAYFVEKHGLNHFDESVALIYEITKRHTGEFAVRPFIQGYQADMLAIMKIWSQDENFHVRRLSCEGIRPRLPWAKKLDVFIEAPQLILPVLENLKQDQSRFVQKSVANCLNDILKDNYTIAMDMIKRWGQSDNKNTRWIIKHALRNELKKQSPEAEAILIFHKYR